MMIRLLIALLQTDEIRVIVQQLAMDEVSAIANLQHRHRLMKMFMMVNMIMNIVMMNMTMMEMV